MILFCHVSMWRSLHQHKPHHEQRVPKAWFSFSVLGRQNTLSPNRHSWFSSLSIRFMRTFDRQKTLFTHHCRRIHRFYSCEQNRIMIPFTKAVICCFVMVFDCYEIDLVHKHILWTEILVDDVALLKYSETEYLGVYTRSPHLSVHTCYCCILILTEKEREIQRVRVRI